MRAGCGIEYPADAMDVGEPTRRGRPTSLHRGLVEIRDDRRRRYRFTAGGSARCLTVIISDWLSSAVGSSLPRIISLSRSSLLPACPPSPRPPPPRTPFSRCRYFNGLICSFGIPVRIAHGPRVLVIPLLSVN